MAEVEVASEAALWDWLSDNHDGEGAWLVTWKAAHPDRYVGREAVLDALIAHGWIDGRRKKLDADRTVQWIAPRQQQAWARSPPTRPTAPSDFVDAPPRRDRCPTCLTTSTSRSPYPWRIDLII